MSRVKLFMKVLACPLRRVVVVAVVTAAHLAAVAVPAASAQGGGFSDVPDDAYYTTPVADLANSGVFAGTGCDGGLGFCPEEPVKRETMAVWVVRVLDGHDPAPVTTTRFDDVDADGFHARFIERMAELGITTGCGDGSGFCPDRSVTRAQMAVFISRAYDLPEGPDPSFSDVPDDAWYQEDVAALAASRISVGCGDGTRFCPGDDTTRGQMATFLWRAENPEWQPDTTDPSGSSAFELNPAMEGGGIISVGWGSACAVDRDGSIQCWRFEDGGHVPLEAPSGTFKSVAVGADVACAFDRGDGIVCWGWPWNRWSWSWYEGQAGSYVLLEVPSGKFQSFTVSLDRSDVNVFGYDYPELCGIRDDDSVECWRWAWAQYYRSGLNDQVWGDLAGIYELDETPAGTFKAVSGAKQIQDGGSHLCGIRSDDSVECWGWDWEWGNLQKRDNVPVGTFKALASDARSSTHCGIRSDGSIECWPVSSYLTVEGFHQWSDPTDKFVSVSVADSTRCGIKTDRTITCWGYTPSWVDPAGEFIALSVGTTFSSKRVHDYYQTLGDSEIGEGVPPHVCGVRADRTITCWVRERSYDPLSSG